MFEKEKAASYNGSRIQFRTWCNTTTGYQPHRYWYVLVGYGSCSGCDTLEGIRNYDNTPPNENQVQEYWTLCLHVAQGLKEMEG